MVQLSLLKCMRGDDDDHERLMTGEREGPCLIRCGEVYSPRVQDTRFVSERELRVTRWRLCQSEHRHGKVQACRRKCCSVGQCLIKLYYSNFLVRHRTCQEMEHIIMVVVGGQFTISNALWESFCKSLCIGRFLSFSSSLRSTQVVGLNSLILSPPRLYS